MPPKKTRKAQAQKQQKVSGTGDAQLDDVLKWAKMTQAHMVAVERGASSDDNSEKLSEYQSELFAALNVLTGRMSADEAELKDFTGRLTDKQLLSSELLYEEAIKERERLREAADSEPMEIEDADNVDEPVATTCEVTEQPLPSLTAFEEAFRITVLLSDDEGDDPVGDDEDDDEDEASSQEGEDTAMTGVSNSEVDAEDQYDSREIKMLTQEEKREQFPKLYQEALKLEERQRGYWRPNVRTRREGDLIDLMLDTGRCSPPTDDEGPKQEGEVGELPEERAGKWTDADKQRLHSLGKLPIFQRDFEAEWAEQERKKREKKAAKLLAIEQAEAKEKAEEAERRATAGAGEVAEEEDEEPAKEEEDEERTEEVEDEEATKDEGGEEPAEANDVMMEEADAASVKAEESHEQYVRDLLAGGAEGSAGTFTQAAIEEVWEREEARRGGGDEDLDMEDPFELWWGNDDKLHEAQETRKRELEQEDDDEFLF